MEVKIKKIINVVWICARISQEVKHPVNVATWIRKIRMPAVLAARIANLKKRKGVAKVVMIAIQSVLGIVMIAGIVSAAQKNAKNAVWLVKMVPATAFYYFFFALGYVAKLIGIDTVVMSVTSAVSNAVGNQVKNSQFFHYF